MAFLTKQQILDVNDTPSEVVAVPEWGGDVYVEGMTGSERDGLESDIASRKGKEVQINLRNFRAKLVAKCAKDPETHMRLFNDQDVLALGHKSAKALERVFDVARRLSGFSEDDVEELVGNSESGRNDGSGSGSL
ncbi:MAG: hypothetical protein ACOYM3_01125 [Terrimicrobiaceae bacterium]